MELNEINIFWQKVIDKAKNFIEHEGFFETHVKKLKPSYFYNNTIYCATDSAFVTNVLVDSYLDKFNEEI